MPIIESREDIDAYRDIFDGLWESATLRVSLLDVEGDIRVPNGELILNRSAKDEQEEVLYEVANFSIIEKVVTNPFALIEQLAESELVLDGEPVEAEVGLLEHNTSGYFQTSVTESRVFEDRPRSELHGVFDVKHSREADYSRELTRAEEAVKNAEEPYFTLNKCEYYYFDHHFRGKSSKDPKIILVGKTGLDLDIDEDNVLQLTYPEILEDKLALNVYPVRPYGERPGQKIRIQEQDTDSAEDGLQTYTRESALSGIEQVYFGVYADNESLLFEDYHNPDVELANDRFRIFNNYDQKGDLERYLTGKKDTNQFEVAVLNLFSIAGYAVQWFGDSDFVVPNYSRESPEPKPGEIDVIAHAPDNSRILFIECTAQDISAKEHVVDRMENITADKRETEGNVGDTQFAGKQHIPCVATPQSEDQLSEESIQALKNRNITVLSGPDLVDIYEASMEQNEYVQVGPDAGYWFQESL